MKSIHQPKHQQPRTRLWNHHRTRPRTGSQAPRRARSRIDNVGRLCRALVSPKRQAILMRLAHQPQDAQLLARSLGESIRWTRYWLALFRRLGLVDEIRDGLSHRRRYRLSNAVRVKTDDGQVIFQFPEIDRVRMEITMDAAAFNMPPAAH